MLKLNNIFTQYGNIKALKDVSLEINEGEIVCLIGANGAGKSTTLMTISGIVRPTQGTVTFQNQTISGAPSEGIVKLGISQVPEGRKIFPQMSVLENLRLGAFGRTDRNHIKQELERVLELFPILKEKLHQQGGTLSGGQQQMLAVGRALMARPKLLMLDEPSLGLAPVIVEKIFEIIKEINQQGTAVLLVEQNAFAALSLAHRGYVLETGAIVLEGKSQDLLTSKLVAEAYLG